MDSRSQLIDIRLFNLCQKLYGGGVYLYKINT